MICSVLAFVVGCGVNSGSALPAATVIRFPATWTPAPTTTTTPHPPTATLVIQSETSEATANGEIHGRFPSAAYKGIGMWVDTTHMTSDVWRELASRAQLAFGPHAVGMRQINAQVLALAQIDLNGQAGTLPDSAAGDMSEFDGLLLVNVGMGAVQDRFSISDRLLGMARNTLDSRILIASTYAWADGAAFEEHPTESGSLMTRVDGICLCSFLRPSVGPVSTFKGEAQWKKDVDALATLSSNPNLMVLVATRFDQVPEKETNLLQRWLDYALSSFLIAEHGQYAYFSFQGPLADDYMSAGEFQTPLGLPVGDYYSIFGMYARHFQHGLVVVNAGDTAREMPLAQTYLRPSGEQVTNLILEAHTGEILHIAP